MLWTRPSGWLSARDGIISDVTDDRKGLRRWCWRHLRVRNGNVKRARLQKSKSRGPGAAGFTSPRTNVCWWCWSRFRKSNWNWVHKSVEDRQGWLQLGPGLMYVPEEGAGSTNLLQRVGGSSISELGSSMISSPQPSSSMLLRFVMVKSAIRVDLLIKTFGLHPWRPSICPKALKNVFRSQAWHGMAHSATAVTCSPASR